MDETDKLLEEVDEILKMNQYYNDYPKEPIGGGNPYYCCSYCKISDPQINGELKNHTEWCEYRIQKEIEK